MKQIKFWSILLLTVMMMPLVASCGGDDGDDGGNTGNPLVGTWWVEKTSKTRQERKRKVFCGIFFPSLIKILERGCISPRNGV